MLTANVHTGMARFARGETVAPKSMTIATANPATASHLGSNPVRTPIVVVEMMKTAPILIAQVLSIANVIRRSRSQGA